MNFPYVKITKLSAQSSPIVPTPEMEGYIQGQDNGLVSLPIEYTIEGYLLKEIEVGEPVRVHRMIRNGVEKEGQFETSPVTKITETGFETTNSIYHLEKIEKI